MRRQLFLPDPSAVNDLTVAYRVSGGAMFHDCPLIEDGGGCHSQGPEELFRHKIPITLTAGVFNDHAEQEITGVAVLMALSRRETYRVFGYRLESFRSGDVCPGAQV